MTTNDERRCFVALPVARSEAWRQMATFAGHWVLRGFGLWAVEERATGRFIGLYRFSRNPMYIALVLILIGWALTLPSFVLWPYAGAIAVAFHLRVIWGEEPWLAEHHGEEWTSYAARVPRWGLSLHRTVIDGADQ